MKTTFRLAAPDDLERVVATYNSIIPLGTVTADLEPVTPESRLDWFASHNEHDRPLWVVEHNGDYAGWMSFSSFYGRPAYSGTAELSIYLDPGARGKGIGRECMMKAIASASSCRIHTLLGFIFNTNGSSIRLFEDAGFEKWGVLPGVAHIGDEKRDLIIYGRKV
jgi:L-amino acid N-acyltransferase YncA